MKPGSLLIEICSLKSILKGAFIFAKQFDIEILSLHPLFGPTTNLKGKNLAVIPIKSGAKSKKVLEFLSSLDLNIFETTIDEHDKKVAVTQALFHLTIKELCNMADERFVTTNFMKIIEIFEKSRNNNCLFNCLIKNNPFLEEVIIKFKKNISS